MKFTIFTPTILRQSLIRACRSVDSQTHTDWEHVVIVDTGISTDILTKIEHPQRKIVFCKTPHGGWGHQCTHEAYPLATGDYLYRLDDDNFLADNQVLESLNQKVTETNGPHWVTFPILRFGKQLFSDPPAFQQIDTGSFIVRRDVGQWKNSASYHGDWETIHDLMQYPRGQYLDRPLMTMPESSISPVPDGNTLVSIYTPCHDTQYLREAYNSIKDQNFYEWIVVYNNGAVPIDFQDSRVKTHVLYKSPEKVGALKAYACEQATGEILLELDHDDLLMPNAISEVRDAFSDREIGFVYSNAVSINMDGTDRARYSEIFGWKYRKVTIAGVERDEEISFEPTPEAVSRIWFAPNHLRAFRRSVYRRIGGYDKSMQILDDQDLIARMYVATKFHHIDAALYVYRVHGANSWLRFNSDIQSGVWSLYDKHIHQIVKRWAGTTGHPILEYRGNGKDVRKRANSSVSVVFANDTLAQSRDPLDAMKEISRVLIPGGWLMGTVPSTDGRGAYQDPRHVSFWCENSFLYYTDKRWAQYINTPVRFQAPRLYTTEKDQNQVCWTVFNLINLKDGYRPCGAVNI
jgi:glycosyltransferase involved in cell wall biosynthesis